MWAAITQFFRCAALVLRVWAGIKTYELENQVRLQNETDEKEIERLRAAAASGDDPTGSTLAADRLQAIVDRRALVPSNLFSTDTGGASRDADTNG